jgi:hypothetical protein
MADSWNLFAVLVHASKTVFTNAFIVLDHLLSLAILC